MDNVQVDSAARRINDLTDSGTRTPRDRAFRAARRHTALVRVLRIVLPVAAVGLLASYSLFVRQSYKIQTAGKGEITFGTVSFSTEALKAFAPKYEGFNTDGGHYTLTAKSAEQDFRQTGPVKLDAITGRLTETNNSVTRLKAVRGDFFDKTGVLELFERVDVDGDNGLRAVMTRATVKTKESRIETDEPVVVDMPGTNIRSKRMVIEQKKRTVVFSDGVQTRLSQDQSKPRPAARTETPAGLATGDGPIDIVSQQLAVDDLAKVALFSGDVVAKQGPATLTTPELEVLYEEQQGQKAAGEAESQQPPPPPSAATASRVKLIRAKRDVVMVNGTQRATGASADFDQRGDTVRLFGPVEITQEPDRRATGDEAFVDNRQDTILMTGTVVITQARNMLRGRRMLVNRKASTMQMTSPADASGPVGRVFARLYSADADPAGQPTQAASKRRSATPQPQPAVTKDPNALFTAQRDPNQPIDIDAASLDVDDVKKVAIFRGNVVAVQGDYTVRTPELAAMYTGDSAMGFGTTAAPAAGDKRPTNELRRVEARQRVAITTKDGQSATGSFAEFDPKTNMATITGDVVLTRGDAVTRGSRATMDMTTGKFAMVEAPQTGAAAGAGAGAAKVRPTFLIYPDKAREAEKKAATPPAAAPTAPKAAAPASSSAPAAAAPVPAPASKARASGWSSTVNSPVERD